MNYYEMTIKPEPGTYFSLGNCRECGSNDAFYDIALCGDDAVRVRVECQACGYRGPKWCDTVPEAQALWNGRPPEKIKLTLSTTID